MNAAILALMLLSQALDPSDQAKPQPESMTKRLQRYCMKMRTDDAVKKFLDENPETWASVAKKWAALKSARQDALLAKQLASNAMQANRTRNMLALIDYSSRRSAVATPSEDPTPYISAYQQASDEYDTILIDLTAEYKTIQQQIDARQEAHPDVGARGLSRRRSIQRPR